MTRVAAARAAVVEALWWLVGLLLWLLLWATIICGVVMVVTVVVYAFWQATHTPHNPGVWP